MRHGKSRWLGACLAAIAFSTPVWAAEPINPASIPPAIRAPNSAEQAELATLSSGIQSATAERRWADAVVLGRKALAIEEATSGPEHPEVAGTLGLMAGWLNRQDKLAEAEPLLRRSLAIFRKSIGDGHPLTASAVNNLAANLEAQGKIADAGPIYLEALSICTKAYGGQHKRTALCYNNLAYNLSRQGRYADAKPYYDQALAIARVAIPEGDADRALIENNVGVNLTAQGRTLEAQPYYDRALAVRLASLGPNDGAVATSYNSIAFNLNAEGRYLAAAPFYRKALDIRTAISPDNRATATSLNNLAHNLNARGRYAEAAPYYAKALAIWEKVYGPDHPVTAIGYSNVAANLEDQGKLAEAQALYEKALKVRQAKLGAWHPDLATGTIKVAHVLAAQGKGAQADPLYTKGIAMRRAALGATHPDLAIALSDQAEMLAGMGVAQHARAVPIAREAVSIARQRREARLTGRASGADAGAAQQALTRAGALDAARLDPLNAAYGTLVHAAWMRSRDAGGEEAALRGEAFEAAQDLDTSAAGQTMAQTAARASAGTPELAKLVRRQQDLTAKARELDARLMASLTGGRQEDAAKLRDEIATTGKELASADQALRKGFPDYAELVAPRALSIAGVQSRLQAGEGLILIVPAGADIYSFAVSSKTVAWNRAAGGAAVTARKVELLRCQADPDVCAPDVTDAMLDKGAAANSPFLRDNYAAFDRQAAYELYRDLVQPVEGALGGAKRLYVTVSGELSGLPLGALVTAAPGAGEDGADPDVLAKTPWLADRYAITTLPSVSVLRALKRQPAGGAPNAFVGYGAPVLQGPDAKAAGRSGEVEAPRVFQTVAPDGSPLADPATLRSFAPLPGTATELAAMTQALKAQGDVVHLGPKATESAVRGDRNLAHARVIAFATHGLLPLQLSGVDEPGLVFTPPAVPSVSDDGLLAASEVARMSLSADWVILSACNTASADGTPGADSLSSLARSFLYAGAQALLASHWRVADDATAALTVETLRLRQADPAISRAEALGGAMRAVRTGKRVDGSAVPGWDKAWAHPTAWAPFSVISSEDR